MNSSANERSGARVAVKCILGHIADVARFEREAELLAQIEHPGLVRYVAHGTTATGDAYLAMEWLDGEDLAARLTRGPLAPVDAAALVARVADALSALHARRVVHRDVKPANIFLPVDRPEQPKLLDLGIARAMARETRLTPTGAALGTPAYMAPEQVRGERADERADVFALGCVLYECVAGWPPFQGESPLAVLMKVLLEEPPRLDELVPIAPSLAELCARMLSKQAEARPEHGAAVRDALIEIQRRGSEAPPPRAIGVTAAERRVVSIAITAGIDVTGDTLLPPERAAIEERAHAAVAECGGALQVLASGAMVAMPVHAAAPTDRAACAARCALALADVLGRPPIAVVTGLAVVAGRVPFGEAIDRAVRLLASGAPEDRRLRVDDVSAGLLDARFEIAGSDGERWLVRERDLVDPARLLLGRPAPFVGRDKELAFLLATLDECAGESVARAVLVTAAAGAGKSRLIREFLRAASARHPGIEIVVARGDSLGAGSPLAMAGQVIRRAAAIADGEPTDAKVEKLTARVQRLLPEDAPVVCELLREIAGLPVPKAHASEALRAARQDPAAMADAASAAWEKWLEAECAAGPRAIVLEDLQWGDRPTVQLRNAALRNFAERPLLVVATARPEVHDVFPKFWAERDVVEQRLGALSKAASERLVKEVLGPAADERRVQMIVQRAGGHPFLLEELIRAVAEDRAGDTLPEGALGMVQARLDALSPEARRVLRAASVFGESFRRGGVAALLGGEDPALVRALAELKAKEIIAAPAGPRRAGDEEYAFRHALVRDAAYAMLTDADRMAAHALAGEHLEQAGDHDALVLAQHYDKSHVASKAIAWYQRAAEQALEGNDPAGAIERAARAIARGAEGEVRGALERLCAEAHYWRGELARSREMATAAASRLPEGSTTWFHAVAALISAAGQAGDNDAAETWGRRAAALSAPSDAVPAQVVCICQAVNQIIWVYRNEAVKELAGRLEELSGGDPDRLGPLVAGWVHRIRMLRGFFDLRLNRARDEATAAMTAFERAGARRLACLMRVFRGAATVCFDAERALEDIRESLATGERLRASYVVGFARFYRAFILLSAGRFEEAEATARELTEALRESRRARCICLLYAAEAAFAQGRWSSAREAALESAEAVPTAAFKAPALALAAVAAAGAGDLEEARALVCRARESMGPSPYRRLAGVEGLSVELALARGFAAVGQLEDARALLRLSLATLRAAADELADPEERAAFLSSPVPFRAIVELGERLGLTLEG